MLCKFAAGLAAFVICVGTGYSLDNANIEPNKVNLTVYFEGLCPDSQMFFTYQLAPTYKNLSEYLIINLVPYGKASTLQKGRDQWEFRCQHGPKECILNKMMACGQSTLTGNQDAQVKFDSCVMASGYNAVLSPEYCAMQTGIVTKNLTNCMYSNDGSYLLNEMGKLTPRPLSFVPRVDVDGTYNPVDQDLILSNLPKFVCEKLSYVPEKCQGRLSPKTPKWYNFLFAG